MPAKDESALRVVEIENQLSVQRYLEDALYDWAGRQGLQEQLWMSNLRLFLMALACSIAALTHFNGQTFPENRGIILAAIIGYSSISAALQLMSWFVDGNILMSTHPAKETPYGTLPALNFALTMERGQFDFCIRVSDSKHRELSQVRKSVTKFFTAEGHFAKSLFEAELHQLMQAVASKAGQ